jgi:FAD/FMN-containing dehydrogenase
MITFEADSLEVIQNWVSNRIEQKQAFRICGNGTRFVSETSGKSTANSRDLLSLKNLNATRFFDPEDMVVGVESGMSIRTLQELLGERSMLLPVNPWFPDSSVGSVVACNDFGPNRMNMGGLRDCIIGIEYINGKGEIVHAGGKVVKNVSGYDLTRMMLGSQGGLGIITAVNFKLMPKPVEAHGMFGIFNSTSWLLQVAEIHKRRIPLDWIQAVSTVGSNWMLGLGYSGNEPNRNRIESEIIGVFGDNLTILADGESLSRQKFTPGENRFEGFLSVIRDVWGMPESHFHVFMTAATENILNFPFELFHKENFKIIIHPIGGDIHFMHESSDRKEQIQYLEKIKSALVHPDSKLRWVSTNPESSLEDLGKFGVASGYSLTQRLKRHLDPSGVFSSSYYDLELDA